MTMKKVFALMLAVVMLATLLVGCGGPKTGVDAIKESGKLTVYTEAGFAPYEFYYNNEIVGVDMEIMKALADKMGLELVIEDMDFDAVVTSVGKNNIDIAASGLTIKESRKQAVNFSDPYFSEAFQVLLVLKTNTEFDACTDKAQIEEILKAK
jgi:polar amino acid transport system substrate-binding protein